MRTPRCPKSRKKPRSAHSDGQFISDAVSASVPRAAVASDAARIRALAQNELGGSMYLHRVLELFDLAATDGDSVYVIESDDAIAAAARFGPVDGALGVWRVHAILAS